MRLVGLFGRYPANRGEAGDRGERGDSFVSVYTSCTSDPTKADIVLLNYIYAKSILVDNHCYNLISAKPVTAADYPGVGDPALTDPVPTITSGHNTCAECIATLPYENWLKCADDSFAASLNPGHTDVDYAWLCIGGVWVKCYNASMTGVTPTDPSVFKQCNTTPTQCADLVGVPASDNFNNSACDTGSVSDLIWTFRWRNSGTGSTSITSSQMRVTANSGSNSRLVYNKVADGSGIDGEIMVEVDISINQWGYTSSGHNTGAVLTLEIGASTYECIFRKTSAGVEAQAQLNGTNGTPVAIGVTTITFKFTRNASNVIEGFYNGTSLGVTKVDSGTITGIRLASYTAGGSGNSQISDFDNFEVRDAETGGAEINIDPTGEACS